MPVAGEEAAPSIQAPLSHSKSHVWCGGAPPPGVTQLVFPVVWQPQKEVGECLPEGEQGSHRFAACKWGVLERACMYLILKSLGK